MAEGKWEDLGAADSFGNQQVSETTLGKLKLAFRLEIERSR